MIEIFTVEIDEKGDAMTQVAKLIEAGLGMGEPEKLGNADLYKAEFHRLPKPELFMPYHKYFMIWKKNRILKIIERREYLRPDCYSQSHYPCVASSETVLYKAPLKERMSTALRAIFVEW